MTKRFRIVGALLCVVLLAVFAMSIGMTAAIWTSQGVGSDTVAPAVDSPMNWNPWAKYFDGPVDDVSLEIRLTSFHTDQIGLNLETVVIPIYVEKTKDGATIKYKVTDIGNGLFFEDTLKNLPVILYISPSVKHIDALAFAALPNLEKVVFGVNVDGDGNIVDGVDCVIENYAFFNCRSLKTVVTNGRNLTDNSGAAVTASHAAFMGCAADLTIS